jgi:dihydroneopterin triphosphate diphosphatase
MSRCPFQVLVIPFLRLEQNNIQYCIFRRVDELYWQGIAGGGEDLESPLQAAKREVVEESGISKSSRYFKLETTSSIPVYFFAERHHWHENKYVIPNYCFAVEAFSKLLRI